MQVCTPISWSPRCVLLCKALFKDVRILSGADPEILSSFGLSFVHQLSFRQESLDRVQMSSQARARGVIESDVFGVA